MVDIEKSIIEIRELIDKGELIEASKLIQDLDIEKCRKLETKARYLLLKSEILRNQGDYFLASDFIKEAFSLSKKAEEPHLQFSILALMRNIIAWHNNEKKMIEFNEFARPELERIQRDFPKEIRAIECRFLRLLASAYLPIDRKKSFKLIFDSLTVAMERGNKGVAASILHSIVIMYMDIADYENALEYAHKCHELCLELGKEKILSPLGDNQNNHGQLGLIYLRLGNLDKTIEHAKKNFELSEKSGDGFGKAYSNFLLGWAYNGLGDFKKALVHAKEGYDYWHEKKELFGAAWCVLIMAAVSRKKGELDQSLNFYFEAEEIYRNWGNEFSLARTLQGIGIVYREKGMLDKATKNFKEALHGFLKNIEYAYERPGREISLSYYYLIIISIENNDLGMAYDYFSKFEKFMKNETGNRIVEHRYLVCKALLQLKSEDSKELIEAEEILNQVISEDLTDFEIYIMTIYSLCELNIKKIQETKNGILLLQQTEDLLNNLNKKAKEENSYSIMSETYLLQSQISLIKLEIEKAEDLLIKAQALAEEHELEPLSVKISNVYDILLGHLDKWDEFTSLLPTIADRLELTNIEEMLDELVRFQSLLSSVTIETEKPSLVFIINNNGNVLFAEKYDPTLLDSTKEQLFNLMSDNRFISAKKHVHIPRFRFHEHLIVYTLIGDLFFGYCYVGQSYQARKKLSKFTEAFFAEKLLDLSYNDLRTYSFEVEKRTKINSLIDDIFLT